MDGNAPTALPNGLSDGHASVVHPSMEGHTAASPWDDVLLEVGSAQTNEIEKRRVTAATANSNGNAFVDVFADLVQHELQSDSAQNRYQDIQQDALARAVATRQVSCPEVPEEALQQQITTVMTNPEVNPGDDPQQPLAIRQNQLKENHQKRIERFRANLKNEERALQNTKTAILLTEAKAKAQELVAQRVKDAVKELRPNEVELPKNPREAFAKNPVSDVDGIALPTATFEHVIEVLTSDGVPPQPSLVELLIQQNQAARANRRLNEGICSGMVNGAAKLLKEAHSQPLITNLNTEFPFPPKPLAAEGEDSTRRYYLTILQQSGHKVRRCKEFLSTIEGLLDACERAKQSEPMIAQLLARCEQARANASAYVKHLQHNLNEYRAAQEEEMAMLDDQQEEYRAHIEECNRVLDHHNAHIPAVISERQQWEAKAIADHCTRSVIHGTLAFVTVAVNKMIEVVRQLGTDYDEEASMVTQCNDAQAELVKLAELKLLGLRAEAQNFLKAAEKLLVEQYLAAANFMSAIVKRFRNNLEKAIDDRDHREIRFQRRVCMLLQHKQQGRIAEVLYDWTRVNGKLCLDTLLVKDLTNPPTDYPDPFAGVDAQQKQNTLAKLEELVRLSQGIDRQEAELYPWTNDWLGMMEEVETAGLEQAVIDAAGSDPFHDHMNWVKQLVAGKLIDGLCKLFTLAQTKLQKFILAVNDGDAENEPHASAKLSVILVQVEQKMHRTLDRMEALYGENQPCAVIAGEKGQYRRKTLLEAKNSFHRDFVGNETGDREIPWLRPSPGPLQVVWKSFVADFDRLVLPVLPRPQITPIHMNQPDGDSLFGSQPTSPASSVSSSSAFEVVD